MLRKARLILLALATITVAACDSDGAFTDSSGGANGNDTSTDTLVETPNIRIGRGSGSEFVEGEIDVGLSTLSAGGTTSLSVSVVDESGNSFTTPVEVTFDSVCAQAGNATIDSPVTTKNGVADSTYLADGCIGDDVIRATVDVNGSASEATGTVNVLSPDLGAIEFESSTPTVIALQGTGGTGLSETSQLVFRVVDEFGDPVSGQTVDFTLNTNLGGVSLEPASATSDAQGLVRTTVKSGTVHGAVRVTATIANAGVSTQSDQLAVTTGIPDQDSISLSVECHNVEAWHHDGVEVPVTVFLADRFNNRVPDNTAVTFETEGGSIPGQCFTSDGKCNVNWRSQNPRPDNGRVTVLASAIGEESYTDNNANGVFDDGDVISANLPEAFIDADEDDVFDAGTEEFLDFNSDNAYTSADGGFTGLLCQHSSLCGVANTLHVRQDNLIIMSGSSPVLSSAADVDPFGPTLVDCDDTSVPKITIDASSGADDFCVILRDARNQPMPSGTTIKLSATNGKVATPNSFTVPCTTAPTTYGFTVEGDDTSDSGLYTIEVKSPRGLVTIRQGTVLD